MLKHLNNKDFESEVINSKKAILVDFFATWCGPCKMLSPVLEKISTSRADFDIAKIDVDQEQSLASTYGIEVVPTMLIFKDGKVVDKLEGYVDENTIVSKMSRYM
jgi:thioredoxin 1